MAVSNVLAARASAPGIRASAALAQARACGGFFWAIGIAKAKIGWRAAIGPRAPLAGSSVMLRAVYWPSSGVKHKRKYLLRRLGGGHWPAHAAGMAKARCA